MPGSTVPERVAITSPSSGVKPIVVSTDRPPRTAASDAPAPRWQVTTRNDGVAVAPAAARPRAARRTRATARGTRTAGSPSSRRHGARASRTSTPPRAASRGTPCRSRRRAGRPGSAARTASIAGERLRLVERREGRERRDARDRPRRRARPAPANRVPPWTTRCPTASAAAQPGDRRPRRAARRRPRRSRGRSAVSTTASSGSSTRSLRLLDPALTTRIRPAGVGHAQFAISGASSPSSRVYARASIRLSTSSCRTCPAREREARAPGRSRRSRGGTGRGR